MRLFETHDASIAFANGPPAVVQVCFKAHAFLETHDAGIVVFAFGGGGGCAPNPPPCFKSASLLQSARAFSKTKMRALCLQMGGELRPSQSPLFKVVQELPENSCFLTKSN